MGFVDIIRKLFILGNVVSGVVGLTLLELGLGGLFIYFKYYPEVTVYRDVSIALILLGAGMLFVNVCGAYGAYANNRWVLLTYLISLGGGIAGHLCLVGLTFGGVFDIKKHLETWTSGFGVIRIALSIVGCCLETTGCPNNCVDVYLKPVFGVITGLLVTIELVALLSSFFLWKVIGSRLQGTAYLNKSNSIELN